MVTCGLVPSSDPNVLRSDSRAILSAVTRSSTEGENLLILVDQFEEIFRFSSRLDPIEDRDEKAAFVRLLIETARQANPTYAREGRGAPIYVVVTLRSEYLGQCAQFRDLPEEVDNGQFLVPRMNREQRRLAAEGPVRVAGASIAPHLVQRLLNDTGDDPDQLPVMQHALMRTWDHWRKHRDPDSAIQLRDYETVGGIQGAINQHADEAWKDACAALPQSGDRIVRRLFQRLRERERDGGDSRRLAEFADLLAVAECTTEELNTVAECFQREGRTFLIRSDDEFDITHEALLRKWDRLRRWSEEEDDDRTMYKRVLEYARGGARLTGRALGELSAWWRERRPTAAWAARYDADFATAEKYLETSAREEQDEREEEDRRQRETQRTRRFKFVLSFASMALAAALVVGLGAYAAIIRQKDRAVDQMLASKAAVAGLEGGARTEAGVLLAVESLKRERNLDTQFLLSKIMGLLPDRLLWPKSLQSMNVAVVPDGTRLIAATQFGLEVHSLTTGRKLTSAHEVGIVGLALDGKGSTLVTATRAGRVIVWKVESLTPIKSLEGCVSPLTALALSRDGNTVAAACGRLQSWKAKGGWDRGVRTFKSSADERPRLGEIFTIALNEDGTTLATGGTELSSRLRVFELPSFRTDDGVTDDISEDIHALYIGSSGRNQGSVVVAATAAGVRVWRLQKKAMKQEKFLPHPQRVTSISVSADERYVLTGSEDGLARLWKIDEEREIARMLLGGPIRSVALASDAGVMAVGGRASITQGTDGPDGMLTQVWQLPGLRFAVRPFEFDRQVKVNGRYLLVQNWGNFYDWSVWDSDSLGKVLDSSESDSFPLMKLDRPLAIGVSQKQGLDVVLAVKEFGAGKLGKTLWASAPIARGMLRLRNVTTSPDGRYFALVLDNQVNIVNTATGQKARDFVDRSFLAFGPDSASVLLQKADFSLTLGSLKDDSESAVELPEVKGQIKVVFSPSGALLAGWRGAGSERDESTDEPKRETVRPTLFIWEWQSRRELARLAVGLEISSVSFDETSQHLMALERNGTIHIWRLGGSNRWEEVARLTQGNGSRSAAFLPSGRIGILTNDGYYRLDWSRIASEACRRIKQNLTQEEWGNLVPGEPYPQRRTCPDRP